VVALRGGDGVQDAQSSLPQSNHSAVGLHADGVYTLAASVWRVAVGDLIQLEAGCRPRALIIIIIIFIVVVEVVVVCHVGHASRILVQLTDAPRQINNITLT